MPYFKNLTLALMGRDPFREELELTREQYEKTAEKVQELNDLYYKAVEKFEGTKKRVNDYETLIENLRQRIADKDCLLAEYNAKSEELQEDLSLALGKLRDANDALAANVVAQEDLKKMNGWLNDLCTAMESRDQEKMEQAVEYLGRNAYLLRIAQMHLELLRSVR